MIHLTEQAMTNRMGPIQEAGQMNTYFAYLWGTKIYDRFNYIFYHLICFTKNGHNNNP